MGKRSLPSQNRQPVRDPQPAGLLILGIGNPVMGDDGAGALAIERLMKERLPENVCLQEAGTPGWGLASWLEGWNSVILVDAVEMGAQPGSWRRFQVDETRMLTQDRAYSLHESDLAGGLALADALGMLPERLVIYGIQPARITPGEPVSDELDAPLDEIVAQIVKEANETIPELVGS